MKKLVLIGLTLGLSGTTALAQGSQRIPVRKDAPSPAPAAAPAPAPTPAPAVAPTTDSMRMRTDSMRMQPTDTMRMRTDSMRMQPTTGDVMWTGPLGYTLRAGGRPIYCAESDSAEVAKIAIKTDKFVTGMISPEQAKAVALCAVPGQIASGEMDTYNNRPTFQIDILPTGKQVNAKVDVDAYTGEVLNAKQYGGLRGLAGYIRESAERKKNKMP